MAEPREGDRFLEVVKEEIDARTAEGLQACREMIEKHPPGTMPYTPEELRREVRPWSEVEKLVGEIGLISFRDTRPSPTDWPREQEWDDLAPSSQSSCVRHGLSLIRADYNMEPEPELSTDCADSTD